MTSTDPNEDPVIATDEVPAARPTKSRKRRTILIGSVAVVTLTAGAGIWLASQRPASLSDAWDSEVALTASVSGDFEYSIFTGKLTEAAPGKMSMQDDSKPVDLDKALEDAQASMCERFVNNFNRGDIKYLGYEIDGLLRSLWALRFESMPAPTDDLKAPLRETNEWLDANGYKLPDGGDGYTRMLRDRNQALEVQLGRAYPEHVKSYDDYQKRLERWNTAIYNEKNVAKFQQMYIDRCKITPPQGWKPFTSAELEINLDR